MNQFSISSFIYTENVFKYFSMNYLKADGWKRAPMMSALVANGYWFDYIKALQGCFVKSRFQLQHDAVHYEIGFLIENTVNDDFIARCHLDNVDTNYTFNKAYRIECNSYVSVTLESIKNSNTNSSNFPKFSQHKIIVTQSIDSSSINPPVRSFNFDLPNSLSAKHHWKQRFWLISVSLMSARYRAR